MANTSKKKTFQCKYHTEFETDSLADFKKHISEHDVPNNTSNTKAVVAL